MGDTVDTLEKVVENEELVSKTVPRTVAEIVTWEERRQKMKGACLNCHNDTYVDNFYKQFDDLVVLYNEKFAKPAKQFMDELGADGVLNPNAPFEHNVQWVFWELWHHEGRRARHGASMMGPDYTHWHGTYDLAHNWYTKYIPTLHEMAEKGIRSGDPQKVEAGKALQAKIDEVTNSSDHMWSIDKMDPAEKAKRDKAREEFKARYKE